MTDHLVQTEHYNLSVRIYRAPGCVMLFDELERFKGNFMPAYRIHADMDELIAAKMAKPQGFNPPVQRKGHVHYGAALGRPYPQTMRVDDRMLACPGVGKNGEIPVRVYRPANALDHGACVFYFHGGGFVLGDLESGDTVAWGIAEQVGVVVVSVDYRLAPEHPHPAGPEDCYAAVSYVAGNPSEFDINPERIAIWGDSAGGNLTVAVCMMARDRGGPAIVAQAPVYPALHDRAPYPSHTTYGESVGLTSSFMKDSWDAYAGADRGDDVPVYAAPLRASDFNGLPPAHVHIAEIDPLADDGREYVRCLLEAGVDAELHVARGMIHGFVRARFCGADAAAEFESICRSLRFHLNV